MKTCKALAVGFILAALMLVFAAPFRVLAQEAPQQDQAQPTQNQAAPDQPAQAQPAQDQPSQDQGPQNEPAQNQPAQNQPAQNQPAQDPPGRAARLSFTDGSVSFQPGGEGDWVEAVKNRTLTTGDNLWADKSSRAEFEVGSTAVRVDSETSVTILDLADRVTQLRLSQGSIIVRVRHMDDEDHYEVDTPNSAFTIQRNGEYRLDVSADGNETDVTVWDGRGEVTGGGSSYDVVAGQRASFSGSDQLNHEIAQIPAADDFDNWAFSRDRHAEHSESAEYVSPEVTGSDDLDDSGSWHYVADYGPVWTPTVAVGWAPYRFGHWGWIEPWGWTWVGDEPWGFAPYHYGRWAYVGASWCWVPGPVVIRPVYAPALVGFVGGGFSVGVGAGVGWFPLAPREVFVPWYRTSAAYMTNVNITNTRVSVTQVNNVYINRTNVTNVTYANQRVANAVTAVSRETFVNARPVASNLAKVDPRQLASAPVTRELNVKPERTSVMGSGVAARVRPPASVVNRQVVAVRAPAAPRAPFSQRPTSMNVRTETPREPAAESRSEYNRSPYERPEQAPRQNEFSRPQARPTPNPLVRQAPPPERRPEQQRSEEEKFNRWQQQRPRPAPQSHAPSRAPAPQEKKH